MLLVSTLNQSAGVVTISGSASLNVNASSVTNYNFLNGTLSGATLSIGSGGTFTESGGILAVSTVNQTAGIANFAATAPLNISNSTVLAYNLSGGSLSATSVSVAAGGTFAQTGGSIAAATVGQSGGTVSFNLISPLTLGTANIATYNLLGGALSTPNLMKNSGGTFNWSGGSLNITGSAGLALTSAGPLGGITTLTSTQILSVTNNLSLDSTSNLTVSGGGITAGGISQTGGSAAFSGTTPTLTVATAASNTPAYAISGGTLSASTINLNSGGSFNQTGGSLNSALFIESAGSASFSAGAPLTLSASGINSYTLSGGTLAATMVNLNTGGSFSQSAGTLTATTFNQSAGSVVFSGSSSLLIGTGTGKVTSYALSGGSLATPILTLNAGGTFSFTGGSLSLTNSSLSISSSGPLGAAVNLNNKSLSTSQTTTISSGGSLNTTGGSLTAPALNVLSGTLSGTGTVNANVTVAAAATFSPGNSPGVMTVNGDLTLAGNTNMELGGTTPGNGTGHYDKAIVNGTLTYGGALNVSLYGGFNPSFADSFDLFDFSTRVGDFSSVNLPTLATGLKWNASNLDADGTLSVDHAWKIALTNNGGSALGPDQGDIVTTGHDSLYDSSVFDAGVGDVNGYVDLLGDLHTPANDAPTIILADFSGLQSDINTLLANIYPDATTPSFSVLRYGNALFDQMSQLYAAPGRTWDAAFQFTTLPAGASAGSLDFAWDLTGSNVAVSHLVTVPEPSTACSWLCLCSVPSGGAIGCELRHRLIDGRTSRRHRLLNVL